MHDVEVLRFDFYAHGYDLVMSRGPVFCHIQFETGTAKRPPKISLPRVLAEKPRGGAIWIRLAHDIIMGPYFWFGGAPREPFSAING
jgi:hypothetical protein